MSTYELPRAQTLSDLAEDGEMGFAKGECTKLLAWILSAKSELDYYREKEENED